MTTVWTCTATLCCVRHSPGSSSVYGQHPNPSTFDRIVVADQGQRFSHGSLQREVSGLAQAQQARQHALLKTTAMICEHLKSVGRRGGRRRRHKPTLTATPRISGKSRRWKLSSSTRFVRSFTSVTFCRPFTRVLVRLCTLTLAIICRTNSQVRKTKPVNFLLLVLEGVLLVL